MKKAGSSKNQIYIPIICYLNRDRSKTAKFERNITDKSSSLNATKLLIGRCAKSLFKKNRIITVEKFCRLFVLISNDKDEFKELNDNNVYQLIYNDHDTLTKHLLVSYGEHYIPTYLSSVENILKYIFVHQHITDIIRQYLPLFDYSSYPKMDRAVRHKLYDEKDKLIELKDKNVLEFYTKRLDSQYTVNVYKILLNHYKLSGNKYLPKDIQIGNINKQNPEIIMKARNEVDMIFKRLFEINALLKPDRVLRFYINTGYINKYRDKLRVNGNYQGIDPWPCFNWMEKCVESICECIKICYNIFYPKKKFNTNTIQVMIRQYRYGDTLGFHSDPPEFDQTIFGIVLRNNNPDHGLMFYHTELKQFMINEYPGSCIKFSGGVRWQFYHGLYIKSDNMYPFESRAKDYPKNVVRTSITFRWFTNTKDIPVYDIKNSI